MNWIDIGVMILAFGGLVFGLISGLLTQVGRVVAVISAVYSAIYFHLPVGNWLSRFMDESLAGVLSYIFLLITVYGAFALLILLMDKGIREANLKKYDRFLGGLFGFTKGVLLASVILFGLALYSSPTINRDIKQSYTGYVLLKGVQKAAIYIPQKVQVRLQKTMDEVGKLPKQPL